jgi:hypothetical protein
MVTISSWVALPSRPVAAPAVREPCPGRRPGCPSAHRSAPAAGLRAALGGTALALLTLGAGMTAARPAAPVAAAAATLTARAGLTALTALTSVTPDIRPAAARRIARSMLRRFHWGRRQFTYLNKLWNRESGWRVHARNRHSGAYGIPQALPGRKMASAGPDWRSDARTQIRWGLRYIRRRYGSPRRAWIHEVHAGWY